MNRIFIDTSAIIALLSQNDTAHKQSVKIFARLQNKQAKLISTSYVLVETYALIQRRFGYQALLSFRTEFAPLIDIIWISANEHEQALDFLAAKKINDLSLVDAVSLTIIKRENIHYAFAFDRHFQIDAIVQMLT
ncbi:MAG: PIN domain-containing protein [Deltaproteobacteria bacterium]|nr:PIN domain-containing protein [Deltaproteobacteria bacterium]